MSAPARKPTIDEMLPPPELNDVGGGDFKAIGQGILNTLQTRPDCMLRAHERFLDIGCGIGRVAIPLTQFLNEQGSYEGFDVVQSAIHYCAARITPHYANFRFTHSDIRNSRYNPSGKIDAPAYRFPYPDRSFDFALATSLFTHLLSDSTVQYLRETARVLKPGGRLLATFFLLDHEARRLVKQGKASITFPHQVDASCWVAIKDDPDAAVCYDADYARRIFAEAGLEIQGELGWGTWSGRTVEWGGYQDQIVAVRR